MHIWNERGHQERTWQVLQAVDKVATELGTSMGQIAIAWLAARPAVTSVILGARTVEQLSDNLGAIGVQLSAEQMHSLDRVSEPETPDYPYGEKGQMQRRRNISGSRF